MEDGLPDVGSAVKCNSGWMQSPRTWKLPVIRTSPEQPERMTSLGSADVFRHRRLVLGDVSHFDMLASALGEACPIGFDPVPVHEPVHEIEQAANRDSGMQGRLVPPRREDRVG